MFGIVYGFYQSMNNKSNISKSSKTVPNVVSFELSNISNEMISTYVSLVLCKQLEKIEFDVEKDNKDVRDKLWRVISKILHMIRKIEIIRVDSILEDIRQNYIKMLHTKMYDCYDILDKLKESEYKNLLEISKILYSLYHPEYDVFVEKLTDKLQRVKQDIKNIKNDFEDAIEFYDDYMENMYTMFDTLHNSCIHVQKQAVITHNVIYSSIIDTSINDMIQIPSKEFDLFNCLCDCGINKNK